MFRFIKVEVENILIREFHCNLDDWSKIPSWFMNFEQVLELINTGIRQVILFLQISGAFDWDFKVPNKIRNPKRILETLKYRNEIYFT